MSSPGRTPRGLRAEPDGGVLRVVLDRPEAANAFDVPATLALRAVLDDAEAGGYGAVLVTGEGPHFCAGGDVSSFAAAPEAERAAYLHELATMLGAELRRLADLPVPVVTVVHGAVAGAGLAFVLSSDLVVAARSTRFVWGYGGVGLTPDCGVSYLLPRAVGMQRALDLALGGTVLSAETAHEWGLVTRLADDTEALGVATDLARSLAAGPTGAHGETKRLLRRAWEAGRDEHAADEARTISEQVTTPEADALIARFTSR